MKIKHILIGRQLLITTKSRGLVTVNHTHLHYREICQLLSEEVADETQLFKLVDATVTENNQTQMSGKVTVMSEDKETTISFENDYVFFGNYELPPSLGKKLFAMYRDGLRDFTRFELFLRRLFSNPTKIGYSSAIDYIVKYDLVILPNGNIVAYKGVNHDGWSSNGNPKTIVKSGKVDERGRILNELNKEIRVDRDQVDMNRDVGCSHGLHVGSYSYASGFASRLLTVEVNPADICCVPHDCNCQKIRCCAYTPRNDTFKGDNQAADVPDGRITTPFADVTEDNKIVESDECFSDAVANEDCSDTLSKRIKGYVDKKNKEDNSPGFVLVRQIKGALPKFKVTPQEIIGICHKLGYTVEPDQKHITNTKIY